MTRSTGMPGSIARGSPPRPAIASSITKATYLRASVETRRSSGVATMGRYPGRVSTDESAAIAVEVQHDAGAALVTLGGELEFGTAAALRTTLSDLARQECDPVVV